MAKTIIYGIHAVESALRNDPENIGTIWLDKRMTWFAAVSGKLGRNPKFSDAAIQFCLTCIDPVKTCTGPKLEEGT